MTSDMLIMNDDFVGMLEEEIVSCFVVLSCYLSGGSEESHDFVG